MQRRKLNQENKDNKKKLFILLGVLALLVVVGSVIAINNGKKKRVEETPKETALETVKETEKETEKESSKKEDKKDKKVIQKKDDKKKVKEEVKEDGTVVIESEDEKGNKVVTKIKDNKVEKIVTDKSGKTKTERSNINDKENSGLKTKVKEVVKEKETKKEKSVASKPSKPKQNTKTEKPKENKVTKPSTPSKPKETKKEVVRTTETQSISFNTIDNYAYTGGKSRVYQEGRSGVRTIVKEDGKIVSNTITTQPQDKIIERYVKVQSAEYKTVEKEVDDLDKPIYNEYGRERWFVYNGSTGETKYFYSAEEARNYFRDNKILGNWGTAEDEIVVTDEIVGYETKIIKEEVKVSDEVWEWKH